LNEEFENVMPKKNKNKSSTVSPKNNKKKLTLSFNNDV